MLLDGLGWQLLERNRAQMPALAEFAGGPITTVVPSTTPSVLTSITTGLSPAEHGIVGFRMRIGDGVLNVLRWEMENGDPSPDPERTQPHKAFGGRAIPVVTKSEFRNGGFSRAHIGGARFEGWTLPSMIGERARRLIAEGETFVYAYYSGIDVISHLRGLNDGFLSAELTFTDALVVQILNELPGDVSLLVTADHGQVPLSKDTWVSLAALGDGVEAFSGDGRLRFVHTARGAAAAVLQAAEETLGARAWVFPRERFLDEGWMGPHASADTVARVGDVVLAAREPVAFIDPALPQEVRLRSGHGSMTTDEMLVPLLAAFGRA